MKCSLCDINTKPPICMVPGCQIDDAYECAMARLRGATERLLMILEHRSARNFEIALASVEKAMTALREFD